MLGWLSPSYLICMIRTSRVWSLGSPRSRIYSRVSTNLYWVRAWRSGALHSIVLVGAAVGVVPFIATLEACDTCGTINEIGIEVAIASSGTIVVVGTIRAVDEIAGARYLNRGSLRLRCRSRWHWLEIPRPRATRASLGK